MAWWPTFNLRIQPFKLLSVWSQVKALREIIALDYLPNNASIVKAGKPGAGGYIDCRDVAQFFGCVLYLTALGFCNIIASGYMLLPVPRSI
jgi:hypothetical protein